MLMPHFPSVRPGCPGARPEPHKHLYVGLEDVQVGSKCALASNLLLAGGAGGGVLGAGGCGPPPHRPLPPPTPRCGRVSAQRHRRPVSKEFNCSAVPRSCWNPLLSFNKLTEGSLHCAL